MPWSDKIPSCFGCVDRIFANHPSEKEHAREMLFAAFESNIEFDEYKREIKCWLTSEVKNNPNHIKDQIIRISNISSYF